MILERHLVFKAYHYTLEFCSWVFVLFFFFSTQDTGLLSSPALCQPPGFSAGSLCPEGGQDVLPQATLLPPCQGRLRTGFEDNLGLLSLGRASC